MFEANAFRSFMFVLGIILVGITITMVFVYPTIDIDAKTHSSYVAIMNEQPIRPDSLTIYESVFFNILAKSRATVRHY